MPEKKLKDFMQCFAALEKIYDVVLVQLKPEHFDYFDKHNIKYSIAYPNINNW